MRTGYGEGVYYAEQDWGLDPEVGGGTTDEGWLD